MANNYVYLTKLYRDSYIVGTDPTNRCNNMALLEMRFL